MPLSARDMMERPDAPAPLSTSLEMVHSAASHGIIDEDMDMAEEHARQQGAVDRIGDWLTNYHEEIDHRFSEALREAVAITGLPDIDLEELRNTHDGPFHDDMCLVPELACQVHDAEAPDAMFLSRGIDIAGHFWMAHGRDDSIRDAELRHRHGSLIPPPCMSDITQGFQHDFCENR